MTIWPDTFDVTTPDDVSIVVRRDFDAPPGKVWRAMTEPEHLRRWLGDPSFPLTTCEMDVRVGGGYRWVFSQPDGPGTMGVRGRYDEVERPHRIVSTEQFDDFPGPSVNTLVLDERADGRTAMQQTIRYVDREMRDGWVASGMTEGLGRGYVRLDEALAAID
ncbi:MAG: SRPBCC family protein [Nocardioidaceae bacterium]|nr:SRPBCC family protein [Nocardioidaceae bacterium]